MLIFSRKHNSIYELFVLACKHYYLSLDISAARTDFVINKVIPSFKDSLWLVPIRLSLP